MYDEPGKDIVCAAISSLFCTLCMAFDESEKEEHMEPGYGSLQVMESERADILFEAFLAGFEAIAQQYPANVIIKYMY